MDFDPYEFVTVAEDLLTSPDSATQGYLRTVVGRSYYAAHVLLRRRLEVECLRIFKGRAHTTITTAAMNHPSVTIKQLGHFLDQIRLLRIRADYKPAAANHITQNEAETSIDMALALRAMIDAITLPELRILNSNL